MTSITELSLSTRTANVLRRHNIDTLEILCRLSSCDLGVRKGIGSATIREIQSALTRAGRHLVGDSPKGKAWLERHRWRLRLRLARESMIRAQEYYARLRATYYETLRREQEDVN